MQCFFCSKPAGVSMCGACQRDLEPSFQLLPSMANICLGGCFYSYSPVIQQVIRGVKFQGNMALASRMSIPCDAVPDLLFETDGFVCVPSHWLRQLFRGRPHIPRLFHSLLDEGRDLSHFLKRVGYSRSFYGLTRIERIHRSHENRFLWQGGSDITSVTILDDVCTTGATLSEVARVLKLAGIQEVMVLVMAHQPFILPE